MRIHASKIFTLLLLLLGVLVVLLYLCFGFNIRTLTAEGLVVAAGTLAVILFRHTLRQAHVVRTGMDLLREQDYSSRLVKVGQADADRIVELFNNLMSRLKAESLKVREQNQFLDLLIEASPLAIMSLDDNDVVIMANSISSRLLELNPVGKSFKEIQSPLAQACASLTTDKSITVRLSDTRIYRCSRIHFMDRGIPRPFVLIEVLTEEVRRAERDAYGKVIRVIGHEVNNTLASLRSVLGLLSESTSWGDSEDDREMRLAVEGCDHRAALLSEFIASYTNVVKIPVPVPVRIPLRDAVKAMEPFLRSMASDCGIEIVFNYTGEDETVSIDTVLIEQVIVNIVKNALESISSRPVKEGRITVSVEENRSLTITDNGPGLDREASGGLFTPFFTTKPSGQGLGLMFVAEVLSAHKATFSLTTSPADRLTRFKIQFIS
ncbi:MAG: ATP-binding protein [Muribaculaceae bacterium]|nr:ATP-binding protein [Muribaculaceae bacterium]